MIRSASFGTGLVLLALAGAAGCDRAPPTMVRDHYATLEDCAADWGRAGCDRLLSSGYGGGAFVFRSPAYPDDGRDASQRQSLAEAGSQERTVDAAPGRVIATVREPAALDGAPGRGAAAPSAPRDGGLADGIADALAGLPYYAVYYGIALMLLTVALAVHVALAPYREVRLIRDGNAAVAASMAGVLAGLVLPLARVVELSETLLDLLVWGGTALAVQLAVVFGLRLATASIVARVRDGQVASGAFVGTVAAMLGLLNAAAVTIGFQ